MFTLKNPLVIFSIALLLFLLILTPINCVKGTSDREVPAGHLISVTSRTKRILLSDYVYSTIVTDKGKWEVEGKPSGAFAGESISIYKGFTENYVYFNSSGQSFKFISSSSN